MGGGELARSLFEADLIDEVGFNLHPVLLGAGIPAFHPMSRQINLELATSRVFKNGCMLLTYRVLHREGTTYRPDDLQNGQRAQTTRFQNTDADRGRAPGCIGLQVYPGSTVAWRHIRIKTTYPPGIARPSRVGACRDPVLVGRMKTRSVRHRIHGHRQPVAQLVSNVGHEEKSRGPRCIVCARLRAR